MSAARLKNFEDVDLPMRDLETNSEFSTASATNSQDPFLIYGERAPLTCRQKVERCSKYIFIFISLSLFFFLTMNNCIFDPMWKKVPKYDAYGKIIPQPITNFNSNNSDDDANTCQGITAATILSCGVGGVNCAEGGEEPLCYVRCCRLKITEPWPVMCMIGSTCLCCMGEWAKYAIHVHEYFKVDFFRKEWVD